MDEDKRLMKASWWEGLAVGKTGSCSGGLSKSLIQFSANGWACVPSLQFGLRPNYDRGNGSNGNFLQKDLCQHTAAPRTVVVSTPDPVAGHCRPHLCWRVPSTPRQVWLSLLWGHCSFLLRPGAHKVLLCPPRVPVLWKFWNQIPPAFKVKFPGGSQSLWRIPRLGNPLWALELFQ